MASGLTTALDQLKAAGFHELAVPLRIAGAEFDFEAAFVGTGVSHDLVVLATSKTSIQRLTLLMAALSRALDHLKSKRPLTLILLRDTPSLLERDELERHGRLLLVGDDKPSEADVKRAIAVLMPLVLPGTQSGGKDPVAEVRKALGSNATSPEHLFLVEAAPGGAETVRKSLKEYIDDVFDEDPDGPEAP